MNPKIVKFTPIRSATGNILGFCGLQVMVSLNGKMVEMTLKSKVARNSQTGKVFVSIHQETYDKPDGTKGYSNLANFNKPDYTEFNEAAAQAWKEFAKSNNIVSDEQPSAITHDVNPVYPHGMAKNTQVTINPNEPQIHKQQRQFKEQDEELPF